MNFLIEISKFSEFISNIIPNIYTHKHKNGGGGEEDFSFKISSISVLQGTPKIF